MNNLSEDEHNLRELARQLRCPEGENGIKTAVGMEYNNANMIRQTIDCLRPEPNSAILEIGFGNAAHLAYLFSNYKDVMYTGADISETMVQVARQTAGNQPGMHSPVFVHTDGASLPFPSGTFDYIFTVNTVYFWGDAPAYAREIRRVLKPGGWICLAFCPASFMETLPFTRWGFTLYDVQQVSELFRQAALEVVENHLFEEQLTGPNGVPVDRQFYVVRARR